MKLPNGAVSEYEINKMEDERLSDAVVSAALAWYDAPGKQEMPARDRLLMAVDELYEHRL